MMRRVPFPDSIVAVERRPSPTPRPTTIQMYFVSLGARDFRHSVFRVGTSDLSAHSIVRIVMKAIIACSSYGFQVALLICDGASEHRAFQSIMGELSIAEVMALIETGEMEDTDTDMLGLLFPPPNQQPKEGDGLPGHSELKIAFRHPINGALIFLMSDPVHLIKKLCSSLYKSSKKGDFAEGHVTRSIVKWERIDGEDVECFLSLRQCYDIWRRRVQSNNKFGIRYNRKFTEKHFHPDASTRMRVGPAAQILSGTMGSWAADDAKNGNTFNTALSHYCLKSNEYFDIMNGKRGPIRGGDDGKLRKLTQFARWFEDWRQDLTKRGFGTNAELDAAFISPHCYFDLRLAVHGFVWMCRYFSRPAGPAYLKPIFPGYCNQDIVEHHFGHVRGANGANQNPSIAVAQNSSQDSALMRCHFDKKTNCGGAPLMDIDAPLYKRESTTRQRRKKAKAAAAASAAAASSTSTT